MLPMSDSSNKAASPENTTTKESPDPSSMPEELVWPEEGSAETTTETAYSKMVEKAEATVETAAADNADGASASASPLETIASPLASVRRRRRAYGSSSSSAPTDSLASTAIDIDIDIGMDIDGAAKNTAPDDADATTTPMNEESDNDEQSALHFDSDDEKESSIAGEEGKQEDTSEDDDDDDDDDERMENTKEQSSSSSNKEEAVMNEDATGDVSDSLDGSKENLSPEESEDEDDQDDQLETQPASEASPSVGRTKKTRQELSEASASKKVAAKENANTESPTRITTTTTAAAETSTENTESAPTALLVMPDEDAIIASTDNLYMQVDDKETVTLKDIFSSLTAEYGCKLDKPTKALVRQRLTDLISGNAQPLVDDNGNVSDVGDEDSESEEEQEEQQSDYDEDGDDEASVGGKKKSKNTPKRRKPASTKPRSSSKKRSKKPSTKSLAVRVHADKLRKRRVEELRVRNEELQVHQSKEDQKRAELIAAKFETNTDELRVQRLEQRLDLLQKLDQKRITVMQDGRLPVKEEPIDLKEKEPKKVAEPIKESPAESDSEQSDSDDDMELEFVGAGKGKLAPFALKQNTKPNAMSFLDMADRADGENAKPSKKKMDLTGQTAQASPGRSLSARAALRNKLLAKQRKMGNMWLARELGYKNEEEHLRDCMLVENKKMQLTMKKEEERLQTNERQQLRQRLLLQGEDIAPEESDDDEAFVPTKDGEQEGAVSDDDEEDEEMQLAKAIEKEQANNTGDDLAVGDDDLAVGDDSIPMDTEQESGATHEGSEAVGEPEDDDKLETQAPFESFPNTESSKPSEESPPLDDQAAENSTRPVGKDFDKTISADAVTENTGSDEADGSKDLQDSDDDAEFEMKDEPEEESTEDKPKGPRNSAWKAMLQKDAELAKKLKKRKNGLVEEEADEEEEEEVAGLEDFGFSVHKKKNADDDEDGGDELDEDDLEHVVDDLSDNEGDEEEGENARKDMERKEEKEKHKEMIRRMRDGYDGRRGGIAGGGAGARGVHRFDQLVAADNREDAKRLGLLNDDEVDSDQEGGDKSDADEEEDEALLLDKMLKDRFLHRSSAEEVEENFSDDDAAQENEGEEGGDGGVEENKEDKEQELLAKRFAKRARMQRLLDAHGHDEEFSQAKLIDDDAAMKLELQKMKNGLVRKRTQSTLSRVSSSSNSNAPPTDENATKKQKTASSFGGSFLSGGGSLAIALQANRRTKGRTSFMRGSSTGTQDTMASLQKSIAFNHVVFHATGDSQLSKSNNPSSSNSAFGRGGASCPATTSSSMGSRRHPVPIASRSKSLWSKAVVGGFQKRR